MADNVDEKISEKKPDPSSDFQNGEFIASSDGMGKFPQPTTDPLDPLNWSSIRKHSILAIAMFK